MATIDSVVLVSVTASTQAVTTQSFNIPLIVGTKKTDSDVKVQTFSNPSDLLTSGYTTDSAEYKYAVIMFSQKTQPGSFKVAQRSASGSITADLSAIQAADDTWYGAVFVGLEAADILLAAEAIQATAKIAIFTGDDEAIGDDGDDDLLSELQAKGYDKSAFVYSPKSAELGIDSGIIGGQLPKAPGSSTWHLKPIDGIAPDELTPDVVNRVAGNPEQGTKGKGGNVFIKMGGQNVFVPGQMVDGTFIDLRIGIDSLTSLIKTNIFGMLVSVEKVPYNDAGCTLIENQIRAAIGTHIDYGFIDGQQPIVISHVPVAKVPANVRAQRIAPPFTFECYTTGGIHAVQVKGSINI